MPQKFIFVDMLVSAHRLLQKNPFWCVDRPNERFLRRTDALTNEEFLRGADVLIERRILSANVLTERRIFQVQIWSCMTWINWPEKFIFGVPKDFGIEATRNSFSNALLQRAYFSYLGVPVICLDDYHRVYKNGQGQGGVRLRLTSLSIDKINFLLQDPFFNKFLDWCLHVEECKLAHIIFVSYY